MSVEDVISAIVEAKLAPVQGELRNLLAEVQAVRRAMPPALVSMTDAAKALGLSLSTIRRRVKDGTLPVHRVGRSIRVDLSALNTTTEAEITRLTFEAKRDFRKP